MGKIWQLQEAKNRFSELVEQTIRDGAQVVTRHGEKVVVVLPYREYERMTKQPGSLTEFFMSSPLAGSELEIERDRAFPRGLDLEP